CRAGQAPDHLTGPAVARTWDGPPVVALLDGYVVVVPFAPPARPVTATVGTRGRPRAGSVGSRASCTGKEERKSAARRRYQEGDHQRVRHVTERHGQPGGAGRAADPAHQGPDRAPEGAQARPPQPPRPAPARRPASAVAQLPAGAGHQPLPLAHRAARAAEVTEKER